MLKHHRGRTLDCPDGVPDLEGIELLRVSQANVLYAFAKDVLSLCTELRKPCMVENPSNSLFWITTPWWDISEEIPLYLQDHQACAYGGSRPKWTRLAAKFQEVYTVNLQCDNSHPHEPWGLVKRGNKRVFATSLEVHYPQKLCEAIVHAYFLHLTVQGLQPLADISLQQAAKAVTFSQASLRKHVNCIPTYKPRFFCFMRRIQSLGPPARLPLKVPQ